MYKLKTYYHYEWHEQNYLKKEDAVDDAITYRHATGYTARVIDDSGSVIHESKGKEDGGTVRRIPAGSRV